MRVLLLLTLVFTTTVTFAQYPETYQPDSVYRVNKVKYRILMGSYSRDYKNVSDLFDRDGKRLVTYTIDSSGGRPIQKYVFIYDQAKYMLGVKVYHYTKYDSIAKKVIFYSSPDSTLTISYSYERDSVKRVIGETGKDWRGEIVMKRKYERDPLKIIEQHYKNGRPVSTITSFFDRAWITNRVAGEEESDAGSTYNWEEIHKNTYDKAGRIVKRTTSVKRYVNGIKKETFYYRDSEFRYDSSGLLKEQTFRNPSDNSDWISGLSFTYRYWD